MQTIAIVDHPCNLDRTATLIKQRIDLKWVNKEIYRVRGGYLVCVGLNLSLRDLAASEAEAVACRTSPCTLKDTWQSWTSIRSWCCRQVRE
jgi:hypothetical protein